MKEDDKKIAKFRGLLENLLSTSSSLMMARLQRSWCLADTHDRIHRMRTITVLISELEKIRAINIFATGIGEALVEAVIQGDWQGAETIRTELVQHFENNALVFDQRYTRRGAKSPRIATASLWESFLVAAATAIAEAQRLVEERRPRRS